MGGPCGIATGFCVSSVTMFGSGDSVGRAASSRVSDVAVALLASLSAEAWEADALEKAEEALEADFLFVGGSDLEEADAAAGGSGLGDATCERKVSMASFFISPS